MDYIEQKIAETEKRVYGENQMPVENKTVLRSVLRAEELFYLKQDSVEHSNSAVGDRFNMKTY